MLFIRGKAMSGAPIIIGTNQLPKPPIIAGMTMKNTMIRPCAVISTFHRWCASSMRRPWRTGPILEILDAGCISSTRIRPEMAPPMIPAVIAKIR